MRKRSTREETIYNNLIGKKIVQGDCVNGDKHNH